MLYISLLTLLFPYYSLFFLFVFPLYFSLLSISPFVSMFLAVLPYCFSLCTAKAFLYCLSWLDLPFCLSTTFGLLWVSFLNYPLVCWLPNHYHHHYLVLVMPHSIPRQRDFYFIFLLSVAFPYE